MVVVRFPKEEEGSRVLVAIVSASLVFFRVSSVRRGGRGVDEFALVVVVVVVKEAVVAGARDFSPPRATAAPQVCQGGDGVEAVVEVLGVDAGESEFLGFDEASGEALEVAVGVVEEALELVDFSPGVARVFEASRRVVEGREGVAFQGGLPRVDRGGFGLGRDGAGVGPGGAVRVGFSRSLGVALQSDEGGARGDLGFQGQLEGPDVAGHPRRVGPGLVGFFGGFDLAELCFGNLRLEALRGLAEVPDEFLALDRRLEIRGELLLQTRVGLPRL
mmetsp:Transcript_13886/g.45301  ORF Transcript_13886/g.45301 Transcript_13886/m.45301 type:complete len:275 (+) Transcript_13886:508-1332(+)